MRPNVAASGGAAALCGRDQQGAGGGLSPTHPRGMSDDALATDRAQHQRYRATYQILQTQVGGVSDRLCAAEGLASLEVVHQTEALAGEP